MPLQHAALGLVLLLLAGNSRALNLFTYLPGSAVPLTSPDASTFRVTAGESLRLQAVRFGFDCRAVSGAPCANLVSGTCLVSFAVGSDQSLQPTVVTGSTVDVVYSHVFNTVGSFALNASLVRCLGSSMGTAETVVLAANYVFRIDVAARPLGSLAVSPAALTVGASLSLSGSFASGGTPPLLYRFLLGVWTGRMEPDADDSQAPRALFAVSSSASLVAVAAPVLERDCDNSTGVLQPASYAVTLLLANSEGGYSSGIATALGAVTINPVARIGLLASCSAAPAPLDSAVRVSVGAALAVRARWLSGGTPGDCAVRFRLSDALTGVLLDAAYVASAACVGAGTTDLAAELRPNATLLLAGQSRAARLTAWLADGSAVDSVAASGDVVLAPVAALLTLNASLAVASVGASVTFTALFVANTGAGPLALGWALHRLAADGTEESVAVASAAAVLPANATLARLSMTMGATLLEPGGGATQLRMRMTSTDVCGVVVRHSARANFTLVAAPVLARVDWARDTTTEGGVPLLALASLLGGAPPFTLTLGLVPAGALSPVLANATVSNFMPDAGMPLALTPVFAAALAAPAPVAAVLLSAVDRLGTRVVDASAAAAPAPAVVNPRPRALPDCWPQHATVGTLVQLRLTNVSGGSGASLSASWSLRPLGVDLPAQSTPTPVPFARTEPSAAVAELVLNEALVPPGAAWVRLALELYLNDALGGASGALVGVREARAYARPSCAVGFAPAAGVELGASLTLLCAGAAGGYAGDGASAAVAGAPYSVFWSAQSASDAAAAPVRLAGVTGIAAGASAEASLVLSEALLRPGQYRLTARLADASGGWAVVEAPTLLVISSGADGVVSRPRTLAPSTLTGWRLIVAIVAPLLALCVFGMLLMAAMLRRSQKAHSADDEPALDSPLAPPPTPAPPFGTNTGATAAAGGGNGSSSLNPSGSSGLSDDSSDLLTLFAKTREAIDSTCADIERARAARSASRSAMHSASAGGAWDTPLGGSAGATLRSGIASPTRRTPRRGGAHRRD